MTQQTNPTPTTQDTELDEIRAIINQFGNWQSNKDFQPKKIAADIHQWAERKYGEREAERYSWDSVSIGWNDKEQHERVLLLIKDGKVVQSLLTNDDAILRNYSYDKKRDRYLHNDLVRASHIELWAEQAIAQLTPTTTPNDERED